MSKQLTPHEAYSDQADSYLDRHNIYELFGDLMQKLAIHKPSDPLAFLLSTLQQPSAEHKLICMGPEGCGYQKQVRKLATELNLVHIDIVELIRSEMEAKTELGDIFYNYNSSRVKICDYPADEVVPLITARASQPDCVKQGWILTGFPASRSQAQALQVSGLIATRLILFTIGEATTAEIVKREQDAKLLSDIDDDSEGALTAYNRHLPDIADVYKPILRFVDVEQRPAQVWSDLQAIIKDPSVSKAPRRPARVLLLGPVGAGKRTQCIRLAQKYSIVHISTGRLLEKECAKSSEFKQMIDPFVENGQLVPDGVVIPLVIERLLKNDCKTKGWILDGFPRNIAQARALSKAKIFPTRAVYLNIDEKTALQRLTLRRKDPITNRMYHMDYLPPDWGSVVNRIVHLPRDKESRVRSVFQNCVLNSAELKGFYQSIWYEVDGTTSQREAFDTIEKFLLASIQNVLGPYKTPDPSLAIDGETMESFYDKPVTV